MKILAALLLGGAIAIAGCSSDPEGGTTPPGTTPTENVPETGGPKKELPLPAAYWTKATNLEHYEVYATQAEALAWFETYKTSTDAAPGTSAAKVVALGDARYAALATEVAALWTGYGALFAEDTEGLPPPFVVLVDAPSPEAFAVYDYALGLSPNVFVVHTGAISKDRSALRGLLAHELAHHVLKHAWPKVIERIERFYPANGATGAGFGLEQADDAATRKTAEAYLARAFATGDFPLAQWNGFNRPGSNVERYRTVIHDEAKKTAGAPCTQAETDRNALAAHAFPLLDPTVNEVVATPDDLAKLDTLSKAYVASETTCANGYSGTFFALAAKLLGTTESDVGARATADEVAANDGATNAYDAVVRLTKKDDEVLLATDMKNVRAYTFEEEADDMAIAVLFQISADPRGLSTFLEQVLLTEKGRTTCTALRAKGEPPYGIPSDPHHSTCWRTWHAEKLVAYLSAP